MKKQLFLCAMLCSFFCFAQIKFDSIVTLSSKSSLIYSEFDKTTCCQSGTYSQKYQSGNLLFVSDAFKCRRYSEEKNILEVYYDGKKYFIEDNEKDKNIFLVGKDEKNLAEISIYLNSFLTKKDSITKSAKLYSIVYMDKLKKDALNNFMEETKQTIGLLDAYPVEQYSFTGAKFKIINYNKKTIKYITFNFYGKNAVDDKVGGNLSRKGIGPVEQYAEGEWSFENVWLTNIVEKLKLTSVNIIYMDGSIKNLPITPSNRIIEEDYDRLKKLLED
jgi:hypothetical protein